MRLVKPEPLVIDGRAHYTLTSYGPVSIVVQTQSVTEEDVDLALQAGIIPMGGTLQQASDDAWVRANFADVQTAAELREQARTEMVASVQMMQKELEFDLCAEELCKRLVQEVPQQAVLQLQQSVAQDFAMMLHEQNLSESEFLLQYNMTVEELHEMFAEQARMTAEQGAALDAWIEHRHLTITDTELADYIDVVPTEERQDFIAHAKATGYYEQVREIALRNKALTMVVAEASCTYEEEPLEQAERRRQLMRAELAAQIGEVPQTAAASRAHPHLKLV